MLLTCPECEGKVSDKAGICPHCGYPLNKKVKPKPTKRMRLPNGFGRITELSGNLRKPFRVMITIGRDEHGRPIGKVLKPEGYFATYNEAYKALMEYHSNPYDFKNDITLREVYEKWIEEKAKHVSQSRLRTIKAAWQFCYIIADTKIQTIKTKIIRTVLTEGYKIDKNGTKVQPSENTKKEMKIVLGEIMSYAVEQEIISHNYVNDINLSINNETLTSHIVFTDEEMNIIKNNLDDPIMKLMYIQCYTGFRPAELCELLSANLDTSEWSIIGGKKTAAGKNRIVPIHKNIRGLIQELSDTSIANGTKYLISNGNNRMTYGAYRDKFINTVNTYKLNTAHRPHDCRKQFVTMAKRNNVDEYAIKLIVGHHIADITEAVYTQRDINWLHKEISKIP